jgi:serine/threonine protein phosphatase PrpC
LTSAFFSGNQLFTANCGDSRVILISYDDSDGTKKVKYKQLTTDHKPEMPHEKQRIMTRGGKVL